MGGSEGNRGGVKDVEGVCVCDGSVQACVAVTWCAGAGLSESEEVGGGARRPPRSGWPRVEVRLEVVMEAKECSHRVGGGE